ncbi:hypothetical protein T02_1920 [Trichinella nativa]|uniref:Uncharacterized protein n=1 Tax=Trichinella nativa TaxID=6335 RepID=A0A0V1KYG3_9BILA|nr:hypothetical protein T02_1920 [Trichinella nativa]
MESQGATDRSATSFFFFFFSLVGSKEKKNEKEKERAQFIQIFIDSNSRHYANFRTNLQIGVSVQLAFQQIEECHIRRVELEKRRKRKLPPPPSQLQTHSTNCYIIRKFCLRHRLSRVHFLVEKEDGSIRFCQKQINARWSVTHGNQLMLKNFSCKVHNDEPKSEKMQHVGFATVSAPFLLFQCDMNRLGYFSDRL